MNTLQKRFILLIIVCLVAVNLLIVTPTAVYACSCAPPESPGKELERSTAVFAGKVTAIDVRSNIGIDFTPVKVTFQVTEVWKGPIQTTHIARTGRGGGDCGYHFEAGKEYLVYANGRETNLEVYICSRTAPLATAAGDLFVLGAGIIPTPGSSESVTPNLWLPAAFFILLGVFLIGTGLFMPQLNRRLGIGERSRLFTIPRFRRAARKTEFLSRVVQVALGLGLLIQGIGSSFYTHAILDIFSFLFLGLAGIGILAIIGITVRNWRA